MCIEVNKKKAIIKFSLFILFFLIIFIFAYLYGAELIHLAEHPDEVRKYMLSIGSFGYILFLLIQIIHVIIAVIPGDMLYVLGGFVFGLPIGFLLSYAGVMLGTFAVFYLSRYLGYDFVTIFISKDKIDKISKILNSVKGMLGLFVICLIPMVPKDPLMYVAGLTPIKASKLFFVYALSRIPVTLMWVVIGANAYERNYLEIAITVVILIALVGLGFILQKKESKKLKIDKI
jgi:uncharacterized membrane protein YdjX (TVP38/TMEM64 family)